MSNTSIFINTAVTDMARARTISLSQLASQGFPVLAYNDLREFDFYFHNNGTIEAFSGDPTYGLRATLGNVNLGPFDGTYAVTCGSTSDALQNDTDAAGLQDELNLLSSIISNGGIAVDGEFPNFFLTWKTVGAKPAITADATNLVPNSGIVITTLTTGDATHTERLALTLRQQAISSSTDFDAITSPYDGWTGAIETDTIGALALLLKYGVAVDGFVQVATVLTLEVLTPAGDNVTYYQAPVLLRAKNSDLGATGSANPAGQYVVKGPITTSGLTMATSRLLGRTTAATGGIEEITVGSGLQLVGGVLSSLDFTNPMTGVGDMIYGGTAGAATRLAGNTSATLAVLTQTGDGVNSAAPAWLSTTGTGNVVRANTPTLVTPVLGAATYTTLSGGAVTSSVLTAGRVTFAGTAGLLGDAATLTFNSGTGALSATSFSGAGTGLTGTAASLTAGTALAVAVGGITGLGTGVATALAVNVGTAGAFVVNGGALGTPSGGTVTNLTGTASININGTVNGNTLTTGSSTYTGTAAQTYTFPTTSATIARTDAANTFTGTQTFTTIASPASTDLTIQGTTAASINLKPIGTTGIVLVQTSTLGSSAAMLKLSTVTTTDIPIGIQFTPATAKYGWWVGAQNNVDNGFEITPSTATGGSTFTTPVFKVTQAGAVTFAGAASGITSLAIGGAFSGATTGSFSGNVSIFTSGTAGSLLQLKTSSASGEAEIVWQDSAAVQTMALGYGNASTASPITGINYFSSTNSKDTVFFRGASGLTESARMTGTSGLWTFASGISVNTVTSAASTALILATGTSGTALTIASATNIATFGAAVVATDYCATNNGLYFGATVAATTKITNPSSGTLNFIQATTGSFVFNFAAGTGDANYIFSRTAGTASSWLFYLPSGSTDFRFYSGADRATLTTAGALTLASSITTSAPNGGTAAAWKLGTVAVVSPTSPNRTIELDVAGTIYYLAAKTTNN